MKKIIKLLLCVFCLISLLGGCSSDKPQPQPDPKPQVDPEPEKPDSTVKDYDEYFSVEDHGGNKSSLMLYQNGEFELRDNKSGSSLYIKGMYGKEGDVYMFSNFDSFADLNGEVQHNFEFRDLGNGVLEVMRDLFASKKGELFSLTGNVPDGFVYPEKPEETEKKLLCTYIHENSEYVSEDYLPRLYLYDDGDFAFLENIFEGMGEYKGWYQIVDDVYTCHVEELNFSGFKGDDVKEIVFKMSKDGYLVLQSELCMSLVNDRFYIQVELGG